MKRSIVILSAVFLVGAGYYWFEKTKSEKINMALRVQSAITALERADRQNISVDEFKALLAAHNLTAASHGTLYHQLDSMAASRKEKRRALIKEYEGVRNELDDVVKTSSLHRPQAMDIE